VEEAFRHVAERMLDIPAHRGHDKDAHQDCAEYHIDALVHHGCRGCEGYLRGFDWLLKPMTEMVYAV